MRQTSIFQLAAAFNGVNIGGWELGRVTSTGTGFKDAGSFSGGDLDNWDLSSVTDLNIMFRGASNFNGIIGAWDIANVAKTTGTFRSAGVRSQNLGW